MCTAGWRALRGGNKHSYAGVGNTVRVETSPVNCSGGGHCGGGGNMYYTKSNTNPFESSVVGFLLRKRPVYFTLPPYMNSEGGKSARLGLPRWIVHHASAFARYKW